MQYRADSGQTLTYLMLVSAIIGMIILGATQFLGQVFLRGHGARPVMGVLILLVVAPFLHEFGGSISQVQRHRADSAGIHIGKRLINGIVAGIGLGSRGHGERGFGQNDAGLGHTDQSHGLCAATVTCSI